MATSTDSASRTNTDGPAADEACPICFVGILKQRQHRFSTERGPNLPDCDWLECDSCDYATDPE